MNISAISQVTAQPLQNITAAKLTAIDAIAPATSSAQTVMAAIPSDSITVAISTLGQLLDNTTRLQSRKTTTALTNNALTQTGTNQNSSDITQLTTIAELFVNTFNSLQSSNANLAENPLIPTSSDSLLQAMNAGAQNIEEGSLFEQLAKIGINLQNATLPGSDTLLTLDHIAFQNAVTQDPAGTIALLTQALQVLGNAESNVLTQNQELATGNLATAANSTAISADDINSGRPLNSTELASNDADASLLRELTTEALQSAIISSTSSTVSSNDSATDATAQRINTSNPPQPQGTVSQPAGVITNPPALSKTDNTELPAKSSTTVIEQNSPLGTSTPANVVQNNVARTDAVLDNISAPSSLINTQASSAQALNTATSVQENVFLEKQPSLTLPLTSTVSPVIQKQAEDVINTAMSSRAANLAATTIDNTAPAKTQPVVNQANALADAERTPDKLTQAPAATNNTTATIQPAPEEQAVTATRVATANTIRPQQTTPALANEVVRPANPPVSTAQTAINPLISAAVAAYRMKEAILTTVTERPRATLTDAVAATEAVSAVEAVELDLHEQTNHRQHDAEADLAYHQAEDLGQADKNTDPTDNINVKA